MKQRKTRHKYQHKYSKLPGVYSVHNKSGRFVIATAGYRLVILTLLPRTAAAVFRTSNIRTDFFRLLSMILQAIHNDPNHRL